MAVDEADGPCIELLFHANRSIKLGRQTTYLHDLSVFVFSLFFLFFSFCLSFLNRHFCRRSKLSPQPVPKCENKRDQINSN